MTVGAVGKRYARAILELAKEQQQVERAGRELSEVSALWSGSHELRDFFANPAFSAEARKGVLSQVLSRASISPLVRNSLLYLADCGRLAALPEVANHFSELSAIQAGTVRAVVTSAAALNEAYYGQLQRVLEQVTGKKVSIEKKVDSSLIAGVVTRVGDRIFDGSIRTRLDEIREALLPGA